MPLRRITKFCTATCRASGLRCKNPAAHQMKVCRSHGARPQNTVLRGERHPNYKHGLSTLTAQAAYKASMATFKKLERLGRHAGLYEGTPDRGDSARNLNGSNARPTNAMYAQAMTDLEAQSSTVDRGLWARCYAEADGNEAIAKAGYLRNPPKLRTYP